MISLLNFVNKFVENRLREASKEFDPLFVGSYISQLLFLINQGFQLDVSTLEIVNGINNNTDNLDLPPAQKQAIIEAITWIIK